MVTVFGVPAHWSLLCVREQIKFWGIVSHKDMEEKHYETMQLEVVNINYAM